MIYQGVDGAIELPVDAIIAVGYRVSFKSATASRKWATKTLRSYITDGYLINPVRIQHNLAQFIHIFGRIELLMLGLRR